MADEGPDFSLLPPHIIANILKYLAIEEFRESVLTCKSWYYASCDPRLVRRLELNIFSLESGKVDISFIQRPCNKLYMRSVSFNKLNYCEFFDKFGYFIEHLFLDRPQWRLNQLYEMLAYLPNLKYLRITDSAYRLSVKNFWPFKRLSRLRNTIRANLNRLEVLRLAIYYKEYEGIDQILKYVNVKRLALNECNVLQENRQGMMNYICKGLATEWNTKNLRHLLIHSIEETDTASFFSQMANVDHLQLESLNLSEISSIFYNYNFKQFCKNLTGLKKLRMRAINSDQLKDICTYMKYLEDLNLETFSALDMSPIGRLTQLRCLEYQTHVDQELDELFSQPLKNLTNLRLNQISHANLVQICMNYKNLTELKIFVLKTHDCMPIFQHCQKLRVLRLEFEDVQTVNSKYLESSDEFNITNLKDLETLFISCFVPGITLDLIQKLPRLASNDYGYIDDPEDPAADNNENSHADDGNEAGIEEDEAEVVEPVNDTETGQEILDNNVEDELEDLQEEPEENEIYQEYGDCEWFINLICDN